MRTPQAIYKLKFTRGGHNTPDQSHVEITSDLYELPQKLPCIGKDRIKVYVVKVCSYVHIYIYGIPLSDLNSFRRAIP